MSEKIPQKHTSITVVVLLLIFISILVFVRASPFSGPELSLFRWINDWPDGLRRVFVLLTWFGTEWILPLLLLGALLYKHYRLMAQIFLAGGGAYVASRVIKIVVARPRPFEVLQGVHQRIAESGYGFPSGHTTFAAALSVTLALVLGGRWRLLPWLWIIAVGLSRLYLGVHMPLDVLGGALLGVIAALAVHTTWYLWVDKAQAFLLEIRRRAR